jgi:transcriptional regulator with XRE-family HTH domain
MCGVHPLREEGYRMGKASLESTIRRRELGEELRRHRQRAGFLGWQLAARLGWHASSITRLEKGERSTSEVHITQYLAYCGASNDDIQRLLELNRRAVDDNGFCLQQHGERLPDGLHTLIRHETTASTIANFELVVIPGLLQTEEYIRHGLISMGITRDDQVKNRMQARMDRQAVLRQRQPPQCTFFIHEFALRLVMGNTQVMHDQILHLLFWSGRPQCDIRIVPASAGYVPGMAGPFMMMEYTEHRPLVYLQTETASLFLEEPAAVGQYRVILKDLAKVALDEGQSMGRLAQLANHYNRPGAMDNDDDDPIIAWPDLA